jgi:hypothetical protein
MLYPVYPTQRKEQWEKQGAGVCSDPYLTFQNALNAFVAGFFAQKAASKEMRIIPLKLIMTIVKDAASVATSAR